MAADLLLAVGADSLAVDQVAVAVNDVVDGETTAKVAEALREAVEAADTRRTERHVNVHRTIATVEDPELEARAVTDRTEIATVAEEAVDMAEAAEEMPDSLVDPHRKCPVTMAWSKAKPMCSSPDYLKA
jgi:hypothetical protein